MAGRLHAAHAEISIEIRRGEDLHDLDRAWADLLDRADCQNVFMAPHLLRYAAECGLRVVAVLAWQECDAERRLSGVWGFSIGRPRHALLPLQVLRAPAPEHAYLATPVIDRGCLDSTLQAMFDAIAAAPFLPNAMMLHAMSAEGATADALARVLAACGGTFWRMKETNRWCGKHPRKFKKPSTRFCSLKLRAGRAAAVPRC